MYLSVVVQDDLNSSHYSEFEERNLSHNRNSFSSSSGVDEVKLSLPERIAAKTYRKTIEESRFPSPRNDESTTYSLQYHWNDSEIILKGDEWKPYFEEVTRI